MLQAAVCRRGSRIARAHLVFSESCKTYGDHQRTSRARILSGFLDGSSLSSNPPNSISFKGFRTALFRYPATHSMFELSFGSHFSAHTSNFRCFRAQALGHRVRAKLASQKKKSEETARFDQLDRENNDVLAAFQDTCSKDDAALQAFYDMVNKVKASGKDADISSLQTLETLLAQADSSATIDDKSGIGAACTTLAELYSAAKEPAKSLLYAQKGFEILRRIKDSTAKQEACRCLYTIAVAHCSTAEFEKALKQAEHLQLILRHLEKSNPMRDFTSLKFACQTVLIKCKMSLGMIQEALPHFQRYVKLKEKLVIRDDPSLGAVYIQAAEAFHEADQPAEAVHFALKGLSILAQKFGSSSYQVGYVRALLSEAYYGLGLFEDCLSEYDKARPILETVGGNSIENMAPFIMKSVFSLIELQRYDVAIVRLEELIRSAPKTAVAHAAALVTLAKVYSLSNMKKESFECCNRALRVLENNQQLSITTGEYICSLASTYEMQKHYEGAIALYKKALAIFTQFPGDEAALKAADTEGEIGITFLRSGMFSQAAPYLTNYALKNKTIMGLENTRVMAVHNRIGAEYLQLGRLNEALEQLETAKRLMPSDLTEVDDTIILSLNQNLATVYKVSGRLEDAVACQKAALDTAMNSNHEEIRLVVEEVRKSLETLLQTQAEEQA